jgi:hypothetical protein
MEIKTCESSISTARRLASSRAGPTIVAKPGVGCIAVQARHGHRCGRRLRDHFARPLQIMSVVRIDAFSLAAIYTAMEQNNTVKVQEVWLATKAKVDGEEAR